LIRATKKYLYRRAEPGVAPERVDIGLVGEVKSINTSIIHTLNNQGCIPVIAPTGVGDQGESYNINADTVAGNIAGALKAEKVLFLTDVEGIQNRDGKLLSTLNTDEVQLLKHDGIIDGGMLPKVDACLHAVEQGVGKCHIVDGRVPHAVLLELFTDRGVGTEIVL
jgi:acetylglutamate kinase